MQRMLWIQRISVSLLLMAMLQACSAPSAKPESSYRVMSREAVTLRAATGMTPGQPFRREFEQRDVQGTINDAGRWTIEDVVNHTRLLCGTYEVGIQLGRGASGCSRAEWYNEPEYGTRERHCNSASRIHAGGGTLPVTREQVAAANCVRVLVRCSGTCGSGNASQ